MKKRSTLILAIFCLSIGSVMAQELDEEALLKEPEVLETEVINVDGYVKEKAPAEDRELTEVKTEINKQKKEIVLNKAKAKSYQDLSKSVEKLTETTEEYLEEKRAAREEIANYNLKVKCLQADTPGPECDKVIRRKR